MSDPSPTGTDLAPEQTDVPDKAADRERTRRRRSRSIAIAVLLAALVILFYVITILKMAGNTGIPEI